MLRRFIPQQTRLFGFRFITNLKLTDKEDRYLLPALAPSDNLVDVFQNNIPEFSFPLEIKGSQFGKVLEISEAGEVTVEGENESDVTRWPTAPVIVIDVRNPDEVAEAVKSTDNVEFLHIPLPEFTTRFDKEVLPLLTKLEQSTDQEPTIYTYCMRGIRSMKAAKYVADRGFKAVSICDGVSGIPEGWMTKK